MSLDPAWRTGHVPSEPVQGESPLTLLSGALPSSERRRIDLRSHCPPIRAQKRQNCCAHSVADGYVTDLSVRGITLSPRSVDDLYAAAQLWLRPLSPLEDVGSNLRAMLLSGAQRGTVAESDWPEGEGALEVPPDDVWRSASRTKLPGYRPLADGALSSEMLYRRLDQGSTSTICWIVDEAFAEIGSSVYVRSGGRVVGSHCMLVVGYIPELDAFIVRNSWGIVFGDQGYALVHSSFVNLYTYEKMSHDLPAAA